MLSLADVASAREGDAGRLRPDQATVRALPRVNASADLQLELACGLDDLLRTDDRTGRTVEAAEKAIARSVDLNAPVERELTSDSSVMPWEQEGRGKQRAGTLMPPPPDRAHDGFTMFPERKSKRTNAADAALKKVGSADEVAAESM
jgi:hypothetical protein